MLLNPGMRFDFAGCISPYSDQQVICDSTTVEPELSGQRERKTSSLSQHRFPGDAKRPDEPIGFRVTFTSWDWIRTIQADQNFSNSLIANPGQAQSHRQKQ